MDDTATDNGTGDTKQTVVVTHTDTTKENPFSAGGELSDKAEYIIRHSTISRTAIHIVDPDSPVADGCVEESIEQSNSLQVNAARPGDIKVQEKNGKVLPEPVTPQSVEVEVGQANAKQAEPQQAEQVKLKEGKKCQCCVVM